MRKLVLAASAFASPPPPAFAQDETASFTGFRTEANVGYDIQLGHVGVELKLSDNMYVKGEYRYSNCDSVDN